MLLLLKLILSPSLVAMVTLAGRRWGTHISGMLVSLPVSAGPVLLFFAFEQGSGFAAHAAVGALAGLVATAAYFLVYAWAAMRYGWMVSLLLGTLSYAACTALLLAVPLGAEVALLLALASFALVQRLLPRSQGTVAIAAGVSRLDLPLRMLAAVCITLALTGLAQWLGPQLSGLLTPFPVATSVIASFTLAQQGRLGALAFIRALNGTMYGFCIFCYVLALTLEPPQPQTIATAFALAIGLQLALGTLLHFAANHIASIKPARIKRSHTP